MEVRSSHFRLTLILPFRDEITAIDNTYFSDVMVKFHSRSKYCMQKTNIK